MFLKSSKQQLYYTTKRVHIKHVKTENVTQRHQRSFNPLLPSDLI